MSSLPFDSKPLDVAVAQKIILGTIGFAGVERVSLTDALGRVLWEEIIAPADIPPHPNSAMDGYAVRAADLAECSSESAARLKVVADLPAGYVPKAPLGPGEAIRIMTGAPIPDGADSVVMVERTAKDGEFVKVFKPTRLNENIRPRGEDIRTGDVLMQPGTQLQAAEIGTLAAIQRAFVTVARRPMVAVLSTGDELVEVDEPLAPGKIVNSNAYSLVSLVREAGGIPIQLPLVRDSREALKQAITQALVADVVVSSGGVSVGDYDYVKPVLLEMGLEPKFWRVRMKPGKPLLYGLLHGKPYFGLPGNPVSSMLTFLLFARPALRKLKGYPASNWHLPQITAVTESDIRTKGDRPTFLRANVSYQNGQFVAKAMASQGSGVLSSMLGAEGLIFLEEGTSVVATGQTVPVLLIRNPFRF
ncbi:MAG: molybdopterin molybdotransferase MoeA [Acidobacteria bacterium]|nr:molybdopterin molybdotransferase MoeA [Acidobacteriota bacterium]